MPGPNIGDQIIDFALPSTGDDAVFDSARLRGRNLVLYFYPKDNTPGCTTEGQDFTRLADEFAAANTVVAGVSRDTLRRHENFKSKYGFTFELIADVDERLCEQFDVIRLKKMYGREVRGIERSTFLIDADGVLRHAWRKVKVAGHADTVLEAARALNG